MVRKKKVMMKKDHHSLQTKSDWLFAAFTTSHKNMKDKDQRSRGRRRRRMMAMVCKPTVSWLLVVTGNATTSSWAMESDTFWMFLIPCSMGIQSSCLLSELHTQFNKLSRRRVELCVRTHACVYLIGVSKHRAPIRNLCNFFYCRLWFMIKLQKQVWRCQQPSCKKWQEASKQARKWAAAMVGFRDFQAAARQDRLQSKLSIFWETAEIRKQAGCSGVVTLPGRDQPALSAAAAAS